MTSQGILWSRRGAASVIFAISIIPILGLCGLAVDYGQWARIDSSLTMAANTAALNAVKIAASAEVNNDPNAAQEGYDAGVQWFATEAGANANYLAAGFPNVVTKAGTTVTAQVTFSGRINSIFGRLFGVATYPINGEVAASVQIASYLNVEILLDNSPSMAIGASDGSDGQPDYINTLEQLSPCWPTNALYQIAAPTPAVPLYPKGQWAAPDGEFYQNYQYTAQPSGNNYTGSAPAPVQRTLPPTLTLLVPPQFSQTPYYPGGYSTNPATGALQIDPTAGTTSCQGAGAKLYYQLPPQVLNQPPPYAYALTGPPCAFACHYDNTPGINTSAGNDLYAMARLQWPNVKLRFDLVKAATQDVIGQMQTDDLASGNLKVGVFSFDQTVHQQYPTPGISQNGTTCMGNGGGSEAGGNWAAAEAAVGGYNGVTDTGIQPVVAKLAINSNNDDTDIQGSLACLSQSYLTASGTGQTAASPAKVLFLVTDGFEDFVDPVLGEQRRPLSPAACQHFKDPVSQGGLGYTVYVLYTPYYQVKHQYFFQYMYNNVVPLVGSPLYTALQQCSSDPQNDFISATNQTQLNAALQTFLKAALNNVARFNM